jgi:hypothetical protein
MNQQQIAIFYLKKKAVTGNINHKALNKDTKEQCEDKEGDGEKMMPLT